MLLVPIIIIVLILFGGLIYGFSEPSKTLCTLKACICLEPQEEFVCNYCGFEQRVFSLGIFEIVNWCPGEELVDCTDVDNQKSKIVIDKESCQLVVQHPFILIDEIGVGPAIDSAVQGELSS